MTAPHPATLDREKDTAHLVPDVSPPRQKRPRQTKRGGLFIIDEELIELMQVPDKIARAAIQAWDKNPRESGFPQKIGLLGDRRFRPAVEAYFEHAYGFKLAAPQQRSAR